MPPCGYRPPAVDGLQEFLGDNLAYFIELYRARGLSVEEALASEDEEISRIRSGARGGAWSARAVELNHLFYQQLAAAKPRSWADVERMGLAIIAAAKFELNSLLLPNSIAAE